MNTNELIHKLVEEEARKKVHRLVKLQLSKRMSTIEKAVDEVFDDRTLLPLLRLVIRREIKQWLGDDLYDIMGSKNYSKFMKKVSTKLMRSIKVV